MGTVPGALEGTERPTDIMSERLCVTVSDDIRIGPPPIPLDLESPESGRSGTRARDRVPAAQ